MSDASNRPPARSGGPGGRRGPGGPGRGGPGRGGPGGPRRDGPGGPGRGGPGQDDDFDQRIVDVARVAKVIKGGRRFAFRAMIVVGDRKGRIGLGTGKARAVQDAIRKGTERAKQNMQKVNLLNGTIPHEVLVKNGGAKVLLKPASPGTGVIAGGGVRAVLEAAGVKNVLTKSLGAKSKMNNTRATFDALMSLKNIAEESRRRGKPVSSLVSGKAAPAVDANSSGAGET